MSCFQSEDEDDEDNTKGPTTKSAHPMKCGMSSRVRKEEEGKEDGWHEGEERGKRPDPLRFLPTGEPGPPLTSPPYGLPSHFSSCFLAPLLSAPSLQNMNATAAN